MNRGCSYCTLETCVKTQGWVVTFVFLGNAGRVLWKVRDGEPEPDSDIKRTSVGIYLDLLDVFVNGFFGLLLVLSAMYVPWGITKRRPRLLRIYIYVAILETVLLAMYVILYGVAAAQAIPEPVPDRYPDRAEIGVGAVCAIVVGLLLLLIAIPTYFLLNVSSMYRYMTSDSYRPQQF